MSLINQMLQDLESRGALHEQSALPNFVRPLPETRRLYLAKGLGISIAIVALVTILHGTYKQGSEEHNNWLSGLFEASKSDEPTKPIVSTQKINPPQQPRIHRITSTYKPIETSDYSLRFDSELSNMHIAAQENAVHKPISIPESKPSNTRVAPLADATPVPLRPERTVIDNTSERAVIDKKPRYTSGTEKADAEYRKAVIFLNQGKTEEAIIKLRSALKEDANYVSARQTLVAVLIRQKRFDEAENILQESLNANPAQPATAITLARIQIEKGNNQAAHDTLQQSASSGVNEPNYRAFHAGILQRLGDHALAISEYQAALKLAPDANVWWMGLGISLEAEGRNAEAYNAFTKAKAGGNLPPELDQFVQQKLLRNK